VYKGDFRAPLSADDHETDPEIVSALSAFASFVLALMRSQASTNGCSNRDGADGEAAKDRRLQAIRLEGEGRTFVDMLVLAPGFEARVKRHSTVDKQSDTMNIIGIVAGEPSRGAADFLRFSDPFIRN
jgi:hypothetical protein